MSAQFIEQERARLLERGKDICAAMDLDAVRRDIDAQAGDVMAPRPDHGPLTQHALMITSCQWETFCHAYNMPDPWDPANFTLNMLVRYALFRHRTMKKSQRAGQPQLITFRKDFRHLCMIAASKGIDTLSPLRDAYHNCLFALVEKGILSNTGRPKRIVTKIELNHAIKTSLLDPVVHRNVAYQIQLIALILTIFYTGVRLGNLMPSHKVLKDEWRSLTWKDVTILRQGQDDQGDVLMCRLQLYRVNVLERVVNTRDQEFVRAICSPGTAEFAATMDLPLMLMVLATLRGAAAVSCDDWYASDQVQFVIKPEWCDMPVFCESEHEGTAAALTNTVWNTSYASRAIAKLLKHGNLVGDVNSDSVRRGFMLTATRQLPSELASGMTGLAPGSRAQLKVIQAVAAQLDATALMVDDKMSYFGDDGLQLLQGNISLADYNDRHLTTEERKALVLDKLTTEDLAMERFKLAMEQKYDVDFDLAILNEEEAVVWHRLFRQRTNRVARLSRKAMADKLQRLNQERQQQSSRKSPAKNDAEPATRKRVAFDLASRHNKKIKPATEEQENDEMDVEFDTADCNGDADSLATSSAKATLGPQREHPRFKMLRRLLTLNEKIVGPSKCKLCVDDSTLSDGNTFSGYVTLLQHLVSSLRSPYWTDASYPPSEGTRAGAHTNIMKLSRQAGFSGGRARDLRQNITCPACKMHWTEITRDSFMSHVQAAHPDPCDTSKTLSLKLIQDILFTDHGVHFDERAFDYFLDKQRRESASSRSRLSHKH
ncbi:hypothetical protein BC940DRAFT_330087 [Gongronella butleri]|nr:hypothetical protein BC940DRAFT_330087 [Gongronella butleri]